MIVGVREKSTQIKRPFKFLACWAEHVNFMEIVDGVSVKQVRGSMMFQVFGKLKALKGELKNLHYSSYSNLAARIVEAHNDLMQV